jgi:hypothetical protein
MSDSARETQRKAPLLAYVTPAVVIAINGMVLIRLLLNWREGWHLIGRDRSLTWLVGGFGPVDWFYLLVPIAGIAFEVARSRWSGVVNVLAHLSVFLWLLLVFILASSGAFGFSGAEHVIVAIIHKGLPALAISILFVWLFHSTGRLRPSTVKPGAT